MKGEKHHYNVQKQESNAQQHPINPIDSTCLHNPFVLQTLLIQNKQNEK